MYNLRTGPDQRTHTKYSPSWSGTYFMLSVIFCGLYSPKIITRSPCMTARRYTIWQLAITSAIATTLHFEPVPVARLVSVS